MHLCALNFLALLIVVVMLCCQNAAAHEIDRTYFARADQAIDQAIANHDIPGAVLVAGTDKEIVYAKAYGDRAIEPKKLPTKLDTIYDMASCSKSIGCATSIMILVEQGKIDPNAPVAKYIPEFASHGKGDITVADLLLHHSGLVADNPMSDYADGPEKAWQRIFDTKPISPPGEKFVYSDLNYIVLGALVQRVSGEPLDQFAEEHIFKPLGMTDTMYNPPEPFRDRCAYCAQRDGHWMIGEVHDPRSYALGGVAGHAGVFSTGADVAKWCQMILNGGEVKGGELNGHRIMKASTVAEMTKMRCLPNHTGCRAYGFDYTTPYSPSVRGDRFAAGKTFGHTGYTGTSFWIDPINKCFVILLTNRVHPVDAKSKENLHLRHVVDTFVGEAFLGPVPATQKAEGDLLDTPTVGTLVSTPHARTR